jgi:hypothetical protein
MKGSAKVIGEMKNEARRRRKIGPLRYTFALPTATQANKLGLNWKKHGFVNPYLGDPRINPIREQ